MFTSVILVLMLILMIMITFRPNKDFDFYPIIPKTEPIFISDG